MNTEQLKTFLSLSESRNFSLTAKAMIVAQSTISNRIQELEKEIGQRLFIRNHNGAELTSAGKALLEYAEKIISLEEQAIDQANRVSKFEGRIILGTVYSYYDTRLSNILGNFMKENPDISLKVNFAHSSRIISESRKRTIDIGFTHHYYDHPEYFCKLIEKDDVILITGFQNTRYADGVSISEIKNLPYISSNFLYSKTKEWLFSKHQQFQLEMEIGANIIPFITESENYTLLARNLVKDKVERKELREVPVINGEIPPVEYYMVYRKDDHRHYIKKWLSFFEENIKA
ncbi:LysR family transcriptional regulator [Anaeropeptidivorans aminofermentans]|uniref:LysR family transcriptional regulator n=1 Tax=Anaeropeptidivorans aminofermentans TaxID=2934315 RepID=UPI0020251130|nr:LysR family transcriptional regulator [Anaeropeptidivorans aminofermentans]